MGETTETEMCHACEMNDARRSVWGPGPWQEEPNRKEFVHAGLHCIVHRGLAIWCGYVGLPPGHPAHGKGIHDDVLDDITVHGGLTAAAPCHGHICHIPAPGEPEELWWLGFDTGHFADFNPYMAVAVRDSGGDPADLGMEHYWTIDETIEETKRLAEQLAAMARA